MRPGEAPLEALAAAITRLWQLDAKDPDQAALPRKWAKGLSAGDNNLADLISATQEELKKREGEAPERILLYLDQGEELYTRAAQRDARRFSEVLAEGLGDSRLRAFASLRADYFDRLQADEPLFKCHEHVNVPPLDRAQLHEVVTAPARALGVSFEDGEIANRITTAAAAEPGALPLLSYLLTDMWAAMVRRGDATLRLPAQAIDIGGVLASRAEEFLKANPDRGESAAPPAHAQARDRPARRRAGPPPDDARGMHRCGMGARRSPRRTSLAARGDGRARGGQAHRCRGGARGPVAGLAAACGLAARGARIPGFQGRCGARRAALARDGSGRQGAADRSRPRAGRGMAAHPVGGFIPEVTAFVQRSIAADRAAKERQLRLQRRVTNGAVAAALLMVIIGGRCGPSMGSIGRHQRDREATDKQALLLADAMLADLEQRTAGDVGTAILLALEALPDDTRMLDLMSLRRNCSSMERGAICASGLS